jgi:hypothetical protein
MSVYFYPSGVLAGLTQIQGNEFWGDDSRNTPRRLPPPGRSGPSPPRRRNFFDFLYFRRPIDASPSIPLTARRWNFSLFTGRIPAHTVDVAPARDEDVSRSSLILPRPWHYCNNLQRYGIVPPTEEEMAAAMQHVIDHAADSRASQGQAAAGAQDSEVCNQGQPASQPTHPVQNSSPCADESSYEIVCCGFVIRRQSNA